MADMRLIDAAPLIEYFSGGEAMKSLAESISDARFVEALKNAPTIDPESLRPVGYWTRVVNNLHSCSKCFKDEPMSPKKKKPFCPNCGARMKGEAK